MPALATGIVLAAGTMTFANEWLQQPDTINWRIPVATLLGAGMMDFLSRLDNGAAVGLSIMIFIGAAVTPFNGVSAADEIYRTLLSSPSPFSKKSKKGTKPSGHR
jgi:hypothetical protein